MMASFIFFPRKKRNLKIELRKTIEKCLICANNNELRPLIRTYYRCVVYGEKITLPQAQIFL